MTHRWMVVLLLLVASTALAASDSPEGAPAVTIPIIGDTAGARAFYYSAIFVENHLDREQRIRLDFYPANGTRDRGGFPRYVTVPPRSITVQETDAVHNLLGLVPTNAIGAERLVAVTSTGADDPEGRITARATITALPRDGSGTYRQEVGQVRDAELRGTGEELVFVGARGGPHARTNVGVVNFDRANPAIYAVTISKKDHVISEFTIVAAPGSVAQMTAPGLNEAPDYLTVNVTRTSDSTEKWTAYVSVVDSRTGDGWTAPRVKQPNVVLGCGVHWSCGL